MKQCCCFCSKMKHHYPKMPIIPNKKPAGIQGISNWNICVVPVFFRKFIFLRRYLFFAEIGKLTQCIKSKFHLLLGEMESIVIKLFLKGKLKQWKIYPYDKWLGARSNVGNKMRKITLWAWVSERTYNILKPLLTIGGNPLQNSILFLR